MSSAINFPWRFKGFRQGLPQFKMNVTPRDFIAIFPRETNFVDWKLFP